MPDIELPPGVVKTQSGPAAIGRWIDADKVRFKAMKPQKIRGNRRLFETQLTGVPRGLHAYVGPDAVQVLAVGTEEKLYALNALGTATDITPLRIQSPVTLGDDPFAMTNLSADVVVTHPEHGMITGYFVIFSGAVADHGITISGKYQITALTPNTYQITHSGAASSTGAGGGAAVVAHLALADNPFTTTNGSAVVSVAHTAHGATFGDYVTFSTTTAVGGITIAGEYRITNVTANAYDITHSSAATSGATGGGTGVRAAYQISIGRVSPGLSGGYGVGPYGAEAYGTPRTTSFVILNATFWSLDHYGNLLLAARESGRVYTYQDGVDARATPILNSPSDCIYALVTEERFIFALCADMMVRWPDQDDITDWTAGITDTANTRRLAVGARLIAGSSLGGGVTLVWTDTALYLFQYTGGQLEIYASRVVGTNCGLAGPNAFCVAEGVAFWMSGTGFHMYAGYVAPISNHGDVSGWFFDNMNEVQRSKTVCFYNPRDREVWFIAPSATGDAGEPDFYVAVNIDEWHWTNGTISRVGATHHAVGDKLPVLSTLDGYVHEHEISDDYNDNGVAMDWHIEAGLYRLEGPHPVDIFGFSPDFFEQDGDVMVEVTAKDRPMSASEDSETITLTPTTEMGDLRVAGRYFAFRLSQTAVEDGNFRLGVPVLEIQPAGFRR